MAANYNGAQAYRFELFEPQQAMPAPKKKEVPVGPQRVVEAPKKTKAQKQAEAKEINRRIAVILTVSVVMFMLLGINMYSRTRLTVLGAGGGEDTDEHLGRAEQNGRSSEQTDPEDEHGRGSRLCDKQARHGQGQPLADKLHNRQRFGLRRL